MGSRMTHPRVELRYQKTIISIIKITNYHQQHHISSLATSLSSASTPFAFGGGGGAGGWVLVGCRLLVVLRLSVVGFRPLAHWCRTNTIHNPIVHWL